MLLMQMDHLFIFNFYVLILLFFFRMYTLIHYVAFLDTEPEKQNQQQVHTTAILLLLLLLVLELYYFQYHYYIYRTTATITADLLLLPLLLLLNKDTGTPSAAEGVSHYYSCQCCQCTAAFWYLNKGKQSCRFKLHPVRCNMYNSLSDCTECLEGCQYIDKDTSYQIQSAI